MTMFLKSKLQYLIKTSPKKFTNRFGLESRFTWKIVNHAKRSYMSLLLTQSEVPTQTYL